MHSISYLKDASKTVLGVPGYALNGECWRHWMEPP